MEKIIKNYSLADQIYNHMKDLIVKGELKPGERITELEVAKTYEVSQAPVREALSRLKKEGFVVHHRNKGSFVSNFSSKDIEEIYSFRRVMEPLAIERAIENLNDEHLKTLDELYEKMLAAGVNEDLEGLRKWDEAFHNYIYKIADHDFMYQVWENLSAVSNRIWYLTSQIYFEKLDEIVKLHQPILEAIHERDAEKCIQAFEVHINYTFESLKDK